MALDQVKLHSIMISVSTILRDRRLSASAQFYAADVESKINWNARSFRTARQLESGTNRTTSDGKLANRTQTVVIGMPSNAPASNSSTRTEAARASAYAGVNA
jgi:hypothetical protein